MNDQPPTPDSGIAPPPPTGAYEARPMPEQNPIDELKSWFRDLKAHFAGAFEEAREASSEKRDAMRADYERRTGRRKD